MNTHTRIVRSLRWPTSHSPLQRAAVSTIQVPYPAVAVASSSARHYGTRPRLFTGNHIVSKTFPARRHSHSQPCFHGQDKPARRPKRIIVAITGATGAPYAIRLLEILCDLGVETHLVMSKWALATLKYETDLTEQQIRGLAAVNYTGRDMSAPPSSGSFQHDGMIIVPCSMKTLAAVRIGYCDDLISRSADVTLKEGRKLVMVVRETPLSDIHLENMLFLRRAGAVIFPPVPAFYTKPRGFEDMIDQSVGRMLDCFGIHTDVFKRWSGFERPKPAATAGSDLT